MADTQLTPGRVRQVMAPGGEPGGLEAWTGAAWLPLVDVRHVSPSCLPCTPNIGPALVTFGAVWPAALPWPDRRGERR